MTNAPALRGLCKNAFLLVLIAACALVIAKAIVAGLGMHENFARNGSDDIMRLVSVRDWLAGQGWYDPMQYRLMPPEGVLMHWSRFIDAGIAAIILPLTLFVPMDTAEQIAATIWPTLIMLVTLMVIGFGTRRVFGAMAACFAVLCAVVWPLIGDLHSSAGNLDHHNVQMLMMFILVFSLIWPDRPTAAGIAGGIAAAFSLAVGLEGLTFIIGAGALILVATAFHPTQQARQYLVTFCLALGAGSLLFWIGQTGPALRMVPMCDQLSVTTLSLVGIAIMACLLPLALSKWVRSPIVFLAAAVIVTGVGIAVAWPLLSVCMSGPYAQLPIEAQELISGRITEAKPGILYATDRPVAALIFVLPVIATFLFGATQWTGDRNKPDHNAQQQNALGRLLIMCAIGTVMVFVQMRTITMPATIVPMVGGLVIALRLKDYLNGRDLRAGVILLAVAIPIVAPTLLVQAFKPILPARPETSATQNACRSYASLSTLNEVPPGVILNHLNYGASLLWATHHSVLAAPYHRSADAFLNGVLPFQLEEAALEDYVRNTGATYLLLCRGNKYESRFITSLADGASTDWLRRVPVSRDDQVLFEVLP